VRAEEAQRLAGREASEFLLAEQLESEVRQVVETSVVEEMEAQGLTSTEEGVTRTITDSASTFTDNNSTEVVLVTQNGSGKGLRATTTGSIGVEGAATASSGTAIGVLGTTASSSGRGVQGSATSASGTTYAVRGDNASANGRGVFGFATAAAGTNFGVVGQTLSTNGRAVQGFATSATGTTYAVRGDNASGNGRGVFGIVSAPSGTNFGVFGQSASTSGRGVFGVASAGSGSTIGVLGRVSSASGTAGVFNNTAGGPILSGQNNGTEVFSVDGNGKIEADGTILVDGLRTESNATSPSVIGGFSGNSVTGGPIGATISGGGEFDFPNQVTGEFGTIGGGSDNTVGSSRHATVGGGNTNTASGQNATIGGGANNLASGAFGTVPGGSFNRAQGQYSLAAGRNAKANHDGAFVWGDSTGANVASTTANEFTIRASGGFRMVVGATPDEVFSIDGDGNVEADGEIKLGPSAGLFAPGGVENLRIVRGRVSSAAAVIDGSGFTAAKPSTGTYNVNMSVGFNGFSSPVVIPVNSSPLIAAIFGLSSPTGGFTVRFYDTAGTLTDTEFIFIAAGPRLPAP
jgi:hypothetical protein